MVQIHSKEQRRTFTKLLRIEISVRRCTTLLLLVGAIPYLAWYCSFGDEGNKFDHLVSKHRDVPVGTEGDQHGTGAIQINASNTRKLLDRRRRIGSINRIESPSTVNKKPILILHVGPAKTGTTSLQYMLQQYDEQLLHDNYHYVGQNSSRIPNPFASLCLRRIKTGNLACWNDFAHSLALTRVQGRNVILSNEVISLQAMHHEIIWELLMDVLKPWSPNVLVVVGYRHLHNFIPSTHFELQRNQRWPSPEEKGKAVTPFVHFYKYQYDRLKQFSGPIPTPAATIRWFNPHYNASTLDIEGKEQVEEFLCHILPDAHEACRRHRTERPETPLSLNRNDGQVNYDALALVAFARGLLKKDQTRSFVRNKIKEHNEKKLKHTFNDFPLYCLSPQQEEELFGLSIGHARQCQISISELALRANFELARKKKKFCSIDELNAFETREWLLFFVRAKYVW